MKFSSGKEMYEFVADGNDLYNKNDGLYVFVYNDAGALCCYSLSEDEAKSVATKANKTGEYWGAYLGRGGNILDDADYDCFRCSEDEGARDLYLKPSYDFCEEYFANDGWVETVTAFPDLTK